MALIYDANGFNITANGFKCNGTATKTFDAGEGTHAISGDINLSSTMTFTAGTSMMQIKGTTTATLTSGGKSFYNLRFSEHSTGANSTITVADDITVDNDFDIFRAYGVSTCKATINGNNIYIGRNFTTSASMGCDGTTVLQFNGTGAQTWTGSNAYGNSTNNQVGNPIVVNKDSNTLTFSGTIYTKDSSFTFTKGDCDFGTSKVRFAGTGITYTAGALTVGTSTLEFGSTQTIPSGFLTATGDLYKLSFTEIDVSGASPTITLGGDITVTNTFSTARVASASAPTLTINGNNLYLEGDVSLGDYTGLAGTTVFQITGGATQAISQSSNFYDFANDLVINKSGNTATLSGTWDYKTGTLTYTAGTFSAGTSTLNIKGSCALNTGGGSGISWYNITHSATNTTTLSSALTSTGTHTVSAATTISGTQDIVLKGNFTNSSTFNAGTCTVKVTS